MFRARLSSLLIRLTCLVAASFLGASSEAAENAATATYTIVADGMCCQGCAKKVAAKLYAAPGVMSVKANVADRTVTVTAKSSAKLTLERLWQAVEQGKGEPSQLTTRDAVYTLTRSESLKAEEQPPAGVYVILISELGDMARAEKVAERLRTLRGIEALSVDLASGALHVKAHPKVTLSPWALAALASQSGETVSAVTGPHGRLEIARAGDESRAEPASTASGPEPGLRRR